MIKEGRKGITTWGSEMLSKHKLISCALESLKRSGQLADSFPNSRFEQTLKQQEKLRAQGYLIECSLVSVSNHHENVHVFFLKKKLDLRNNTPYCSSSPSLSHHPSLLSNPVTSPRASPSPTHPSPLPINIRTYLGSKYR